MKLTAQDIVQNMIEINPGLIETTGFVRYHPATGAILQAGHQGRSHTQAKIDEGQPYGFAELPEDMNLLLQYIETHYVDTATGLVHAKEPFPGVRNGQVITGVPVPCRVGVETPFQTGQGYWAPTWYEWSDPDVELSFDIPDTYRVTIESVRYLPIQFEVTA